LHFSQPDDQILLISVITVSTGLESLILSARNIFQDVLRQGQKKPADSNEH
jgi:hypothetical protein